ncbi:hypothetical protein G4B88_004385 [Cannabis sativa]|uniref:CCHC-type domain-containing protein n=1 Tax=Cannabis sativa TaxID=3483 RepID=A0A7J6HZW6_CANSA|nr:hypothetical protein G4B88_004385 [Cannabis sativa]
MVIMKEVCTRETTVEVDTIDSGISNIMQRDSNMEVEMMELFEDLTLEDIVAKKACVGKVIGCKTMAASVVKKILLGIWNLDKGWKMKKFEDGVLGFFFDSEEDCQMVMERRPWLVNGVLLNLRPWPIEGEVCLAEFEVARFWVEFHGLPTRCLSEDNAPILAKKVGTFVKTDGRRKEDVVRRRFLRCWIDVWISHPFPAGFFLKAGANLSSWIQFKYDKLPFLCFNCGRLAHVTGKCSAPTMWVTPATGQAVRMYGPWIKVDGARGNCFTARGSQTELMVNDEGPSFLKLSRPNGKWRRRSDIRPSNGTSHNGNTEAAGDVRDVAEGTMHGTTTMQRSGSVERTEGTKNASKAKVDLYKAQPSLISNPPDISQLITHLLGTRKRKVHAWYHPTPDPFLDSPFIDSNGETHGSISLSGGKIQPLESPKFNAGSVEPGETSKGKSRRRQARGILSSNRKSGVRTRRARLNEENESFGFYDQRLKELYAMLSKIQSSVVTSTALNEEAAIQLEIVEMEEKMERIWKQNFSTLPLLFKGEGTIFGL